MAGRGVAKESPPQFVHGLWIDGEVFEDGVALPISGYDYSPGGTVIRMVGGTLVQNRWLAGDAPMCLEPARWSVEYTVRSLAAQRLFAERANSGFAVPMFFDHEWTDVWYVPGRRGSQGPFSGVDRWLTSRWFPYGIVANISHVNRPVTVRLDGADLLVDELAVAPTAPTVASGHAAVPSYDVGSLGYVLTDGAMSGSRLTLHYHPLVFGLISNVRYLYPTVNGARYSCEVQEHMPGIYNLA